VWVRQIIAQALAQVQVVQISRHQEGALILVAPLSLTSTTIKGEFTMDKKGRKHMFKKMECVSVPVKDLEKAVTFYKSMGLKEAWRIERDEDSTLVGLKFPDKQSSELVLSYKGAVPEMEVEILVEDVIATVNVLKQNPEVTIIVEPFATESGHVAVFEAPDENVYVLVGN